MLVDSQSEHNSSINFLAFQDKRERAPHIKHLLHEFCNKKWFKHCRIDQRTNEHVNAHLVSKPSQDKPWLQMAEGCLSTTSLYFNEGAGNPDLDDF